MRSERLADRVEHRLARPSRPGGHAALNGAAVNGAALDGAALDGAALDGAPLGDAESNGAPLNGARLNGAPLNGAPLNGAPNDAESDTSLSRWLPDATASGPSGWLATVRADPGRAGVVGLVVIGIVAVLVTVFTVMSDDGPVVASAKLPPVQPVSSATPTAGPGQPPTGPVVVSVVGLVHRPGLVTLAAGARIADALSAAGGPVDGADLVGLNMARRVDDGEQIVVGLSSAPGAPPAMGSSVATRVGATPAAKPVVVNLNTATLEELDALPGVGPITAAAIIAWRDANGRFTRVDQLGEVDGIGPARLEKLRALVEV